MNTNKTYCGFVSIVGRSNVGKSTLINKLIGKKVSITSCKTQTTRYSIIGIHTKGVYQTVYIDTPGIQTSKNYINNYLVINRSISDVDLIIFVVEGVCWRQDDEIVLKKLRKEKIPVILVVNKIDSIRKKFILLPHLQFLANQMNFLEVIPISAEYGINIDSIKNVVTKYLPESTFYFPKDHMNAYSHYFIASEIIREKLMRFLGEELPYVVTVKIERCIIKKHGSYEIHGLIFVEREGQKKIVIGKNGNKIKTIGIEARKNMQQIFKVPVYLALWVKVKSRCWIHDDSQGE